MKSKPLDPQEDFWDKNKRLDRPLSPHLTIYKFQLTSMLSITHRGTGLALSALMSGFAIGKTLRQVLLLLLIDTIDASTDKA